METRRGATARERMVMRVSMNGRGAGGAARALSHKHQNTCTDLACLLPVQVALAAAVLRRGGESTGFHILGHPKPTAAFQEGRFRSRTLRRPFSCCFWRSRSCQRPRSKSGPLGGGAPCRYLWEPDGHKILVNFHERKHSMTERIASAGGRNRSSAGSDQRPPR